MGDEYIAYRIMLIGGPLDGEQLIAQNPWHTCWPGTYVYEAERDETGQPIMEDGDLGSGMIEVIQVDTEDIYSPPVKTIKMYWTGKTRELPNV